MRTKMKGCVTKRHLLLCSLLGLLTGCGEDKVIVIDETVPPIPPPTPTFYMASTTNTEGGNISPVSKVLAEGKTFSFSINPDSGYKLDTIEGCDGKLEGNFYTTGSMNENCNITPSFIPLIFTATADALGGGSITPNSQKILQGEKASFTLTPSEGYILDSVSGCNGKLDKLEFTTGEITADCNITGQFILDSVESAINNEDHTLASEEALLTAMREEIGFIESLFSNDIDEIFQGANPTISWAPTTVNVVVSQFNKENSFPILVSNTNKAGTSSSEVHMLLGEKDMQRFGFVGSQVFLSKHDNDTDSIIKNSIAWLTNQSNNKSPLSIVVSNVPPGEYNEINQWLIKNMPGASINPYKTCDYESINSCVENNNADLLMFGAFDYEGKGRDILDIELKKMVTKKVPILSSFTFSHANQPTLEFLKGHFGYSYASNYHVGAKLDRYPTSELKKKLIEKLDFSMVLNSIQELESGSETFNPELYVLCENHLAIDAYCEGEELAASNFYLTMKYFRDAIITAENNATKIFDSEGNDLLKMAILLADKYRINIDYPIAKSEKKEWQQAVFADSLVSYSRLKNIAQPDLGTFVLDTFSIRKGEAANYKHPATLSERKTITLGRQFTDPTPAWTSTGWYTLPGKPVKLQRHDNGLHDVEIIINYGRANTSRMKSARNYLAPAGVSETVWHTKRRLKLKAGQSVTMSSPYGGPIYLAFVTGAGERSVDITATGVAHHPFIDDIYDEDKIARFEQLLNDTEIPHVDVVSIGYEQHFRKDRFLDGLVHPYTDIQSLIQATIEEHMNVLYIRSGFSKPGQTVVQSFSKEYLDICQSLFGEDCLNDTIHTRGRIQHANFDQNATCGAGCGGNPYDSGQPLGPRTWLDNHEMGHGLQIKPLEMNYVEEENKNKWGSYQIRSRESSNNVLASYQKMYVHHIVDGKTDRLRGPDSMKDKDLFFAFMSDANETKNALNQRVVLRGDCSLFPFPEGESRYEAPLKINKDAHYLLHLYLQMNLLADKMEMPNGAILEDGFDIFPLLYQHARIFFHYSRDKATWDENRTRLGFSEFEYDGLPLYSGQKVNYMPGNDFLLVSLNHITKHDWSPFFSLAGLRYSDLAKSQAALNATKSAIPLGMYILDRRYPDASLTDGLTFLPMDKKDARWPLDNTSPIDCSVSF